MNIMIGNVLIIMGLIFIVFGAIGVIRFPDVYTRLLASSKIDTVGIITIFIGLIIKNGFSSISLKIALIIIFIMLTNPVSSHAIAKGAYKSGLRPWQRERRQDV